MTEFENVISVYSIEQAAKLTGLSIAQLRRWDKMGFFKPQYFAENSNAAFSKIYSYRDIVGLRVICVLKKEYKVSLSHLIETATRLEAYAPEHPWAKIKLGIWKGKVTWQNPETGHQESVADGQGIVFELVSVMEDIRQRTEKMAKRQVEDYGKVTKKRNVAHNREVFAGTRISLESVRQFSQAGYTPEQILKEYPTLTMQDINLALSSSKAA